MSIWKETAIAVPALAALLFVSHAYFGSDEIQLMSVPRTWLGGVTIPAERFIAKELIAGRASNADEDFPSLEQKPASELTSAGADKKRLSVNSARAALVPQPSFFGRMSGWRGHRR